MSFLFEGVEDVRALPVPDGMTSDGCSTCVSRTALVTWRSSLEGMLYQVYVDGCLAGTTIDAEQRQLAVQVPSTFQSAVRMEVVAVEPKDAHVDLGAQLDKSDTNSGRITLTLLRSQTLPAWSAANIYFDYGTGTIDYTQSVNAQPISVWPSWHDKAGFGMARFGTGDFGYDSAASIGFGKGSFGNGQFGLEADTMEWISPELPLGRYRLGVTVIDERGNESEAAETEPITAVPPARPATGLRAVSFDQSTGQLTLGISDSA